MAEDLPPPRVLPTNRPARPARQERRRGAGPLAWFGVGAVVVGAGVGGYLLGRGGGESSSAAVAPTATVVATATPPPSPTPAASPAATASTPAPTAPAAVTAPPAPSPTAPAAGTAPPAPVRADPNAEPGPDAPLDVAAVDGQVAAGEVAESRGIVKAGRIYLVGAVPTAEDAAAIVALASEVLGPSNVYNGYYIDPRAGDPSEGDVRVDDTVLFETGSAAIRPEFEPLLNQGLALLTLEPAVTFTVIGHTDSIGSDAANLTLSEARAAAVVAWYVERGVDPARLSAVGRGESEPLASNDTDAGRELNRRIEVVIENLFG